MNFHISIPLVALALGIAACTNAIADQNYLFDIKLADDKNVSADAFRGVLPAKFLQTGQDAKFAEIAKAYDIPIPPNPRGFLQTELSDRIQGDFAFTNISHTFGVVGPPGARGDYVLTQIKFWGGSPVPSRGRVERGLQALIDLLGKPDAVYQYTRGLGEERRVTNTHLKFRWLRSGARLDYDIRHGSLPFRFELSYVPPQALPKIAGRFNKKSWLAVEDPDPMAELKKFLDPIRIVPAGDGGFPVLEPAAKLADRLEQYGDTVSRWGDVIWDKQYRDLAAKLDKTLTADFEHLGKKEKLYSHLLDICKGDVPGFTSGGTQCGAAAYLASFDDPEAIEFLFEAGEVDLPEGVSIYALEGIGRLCTGEVMDRVVSMLDTSESDTAYYILLSLDTEEKFAELQKKLPRTVTSERGKLAGYGAVNNLPSMIENFAAIRARDEAAKKAKDQ